MNSTKNKMDGITILRFFAAFYVFVFHINLRTPLDFGHIVNKIISNGSIGMSIFFMLSGFVLAYNYYDTNLQDYLKKRVARIYPAYIACALLSLPFLFIDNLTWAQRVTCILLYLFCMQAWIYQSFTLWNFGGTWSVSVEMFFYALFPKISKLINKNNILIVVIASYIISALLIPVSRIIGGPTIGSVYYATPIFRLPEFIIGICTGIYFSNGKRVSHVLFLLSLAIFIYSTTISKVKMDTNFLIVPSLAMIICYLGNAHIPKNILTSTMVYLGEISYSFYLMQLPILMYLDHYPDTFLRTHALLSWIMVFALNITFAMLSWHFVEKNKVFKAFFYRKSYAQDNSKVS